MRVSELRRKLVDFDDEARVFIIGEDGENIEVEQVFRILEESKAEEKQDVLLTEWF